MPFLSPGGQLYVFYSCNYKKLYYGVLNMLHYTELFKLNYQKNLSLMYLLMQYGILCARDYSSES